MKAKTVYVVLFRGVGGATQLPTAPLRATLTEAGFENVATYINSGNAVLNSRLTRTGTLAKVAEICAREFGFMKDIHVLTRGQWKTLIEANPFPEAVGTGKFLHAAVLESEPAAAAVEALRRYAVAGEGLEIVGKVAYLHTPGGLSQSKMAVRFDKGLGVGNTARNWNTVMKLMEIADRVAGEAD